MKRLIPAFVVILCCSFLIPQKKKITIWLAGDSTIANKEINAYPETGWGMPFQYFFDSSVAVKNIAKNGRSTKTFISEKLWDSIYNNLHADDYVFIQFGHNDESKTKAERYTPPEDYTKNLIRFITEVKSKKAIPVLITPVARRRFDSLGNVVESHPEYSPLVRKIAAEHKVPFIDLDKKSMELYQQFGKENSKLLFLQLKAGEHPNYPKGKDDNTHFSELGARLIAQIVLQEIKNLKLELEDRIYIGKR